MADREREPKVDRRVAAIGVALFTVGTAIGLVQLIADADTTSANTDEAAANWIHVGLAAGVLAAAAILRGRSKERFRAVLLLPVSTTTGRAVADALSLRRLRTAASAGSLVRRLGAAGAAVPATVLGMVGLVLMAFAPLRAGEQVFAALDPDFTRGAWGGPSYLGASLAHWLDLLVLLYLTTAVVRSLRCRA